MTKKRSRVRTPTAVTEAVAKAVPYINGDPGFFLSQRLKMANGTVDRPYSQSPWVFAAVKAIATNIAGVDFQFYRGERDEDSEALDIRGVKGLAAWQKPNPVQDTQRKFWEAIANLYVLCGSVAVVKESGKNARVTPGTPPIELWPVAGNLFRPVFADAADAVPKAWTLKTRAGEIVYQPHELMWFREFNPYDPWAGLARTEAARLSIIGDVRAQEFNQAFFENGTEVGGVIEVPKEPTREQRVQMREAFEDRHGGASRAHRIAVLGGGSKWIPNNRTQKDMDFAALRNMSRDEILGVFGVPKIIVGIVEDYNRATASSAKATFFENTLIPLMRNFEDVVNLDIATWQGLADVRGYFDLTSVAALKEDMTEKVTTAKTLFELGYPMNAVNERLDLGMPETEMGEQEIVPFNYVLASALERSVYTDDVLPGSETAAEEPAPETETEPESEPLPEGDENRAVTTNWRLYIRDVFDPLEKRAASAFKRYFFELRTHVLKRLDAQVGRALSTGVVKAERLTQAQIDAVLWNETEWNAQLRKVAMGVWKATAEASAKRLATELGGLQFFSVQHPSMVKLFTEKALKVTRINDTVRTRMRDTLAESIAKNETIAETASRVRLEFNFAGSRSTTIARTEVGQVSNVARFEGMKAEGIAKHKWVSAQDEFVRDSHKAVNGEVVAIGAAFSNGLTTPGQPTAPAAEVINCRCVTVPVIEEPKP